MFLGSFVLEKNRFFVFVIIYPCVIININNHMIYVLYLCV